MRYYIGGDAMRVVGHRVRLEERHLEKMRIPRRFWSATLAEVDESVRDRVETFCREIDERLNAGDGMLLWGEYGRGKTCASVVVAKEARRVGAPTLFIMAEDLRQASMNPMAMFDQETSMFDRVRSVEMLVVDDLGKEYEAKGSDWNQRMFENLLRHRGSNCLSTVITTNSSPTELLERYKRSMFEVLKEVTAAVQVEGPNRRRAVGI